MLPDRRTSTAQRRALQALVALLLLGGWSLALAGPVAEFTAHQSVGKRSVHPPVLNSPRPPMLDMALTAIAAVKSPLMLLDEPRPARLNSADPLPASEHARAAEHQPANALAFRWRESREIAGPDIVSLVRNYRRDGLPVMHLYQSNQNSLAIGFNNHGVPGIYFTRHIGG